MEVSSKFDCQNFELQPHFFFFSFRRQASSCSQKQSQLCQIYMGDITYRTVTVPLQTSSLQYFLKYNRTFVDMMCFLMVLKGFEFFGGGVFNSKAGESGSQCACNFKQRHNPFKEEDEEEEGGGKVNMRVSYKKQDLTLV